MAEKLLRPVWAEVNLDNFRKNICSVARVLSENTRIMVVVKANAYGIGAVQAGREALSVDKVSSLAVATPEEALKLRENGLQIPILVLGFVTKEGMEALLRASVSFTVTATKSIRYAQEVASRLNTRAHIHLKIDTGMGRLGFPAESLPEDLASTLHECGNVFVEGIFTHFAAADEEEEYTEKQLSLFNQFIEKLRKKKIYPKYIHAANSAAILKYPNTHLDLVRPGIILYGSCPDVESPVRKHILPVLSLYARVSHVKQVKAGSYIGYGITFQAARETTIVTVPLGYADGYPRILSNRGFVLIKGKKYPIAGRVCMDQFMVDVGNDQVNTGDIVTLLGRDGQEEITVDMLAGMAQTISNEILTGLGPRVPRKYVRGMQT